MSIIKQEVQNLVTRLYNEGNEQKTNELKVL